MFWHAPWCWAKHGAIILRWVLRPTSWLRAHIDICLCVAVWCKWRVPFLREVFHWLSAEQEIGQCDQWVATKHVSEEVLRDRFVVGFANRDISIECCHTPLICAVRCELTKVMRRDNSPRRGSGSVASRAWYDKRQHRGPVNAAAKHVDLDMVRAQCACSRHVACNMVEYSASVGDWRCGQSDHNGKTPLNYLPLTRAIHTSAQPSITSNVLEWTSHRVPSAFRTTVQTKCNF